MRRVKSHHWLETLVMFLAVFSIWPVMLGWEHPGWKVLMYVILAVLTGLFLVNIVRMWRLGHPRRDREL